MKRIYLNVWDKCNLNCLHCFNDGGKINDSVLSIDKIFEFILMAKNSLGISEVQLSGGEPTLRSGIFQLVDKIIDNRIHVILQTNGIFGNTIVKKILQYNSAALSLIISLDGIKTNDYLRGKNPTDITLSNIKKLASSIPVRINTLLTEKISRDEIEQLIHLSEKYNFSLAFNPVVPRGRSDKNLMMDRRKYFDWMIELEEYKKEGIKIRKGFDVKNGQLRETEDCPVRKGDAIHINADGGVHACGFLTDNRFCYAGSLLEQPLDELVDKLKSMRIPLPKRCIDCDFYTAGNCNGGCPARVFSLYGTFDEVEYYCLSAYYNNNDDTTA